MGNGKRLKEILDEKNIRVSELARLTKINKQTLYNIINRDSDIRFDFAFRIANVLDIDVSEICDTDLYVTADTLPNVQRDFNRLADCYKEIEQQINGINERIKELKICLNNLKKAGDLNG